MRHNTFIHAAAAGAGVVIGVAIGAGVVYSAARLIDELAARATYRAWRNSVLRAAGVQPVEVLDEAALRGRRAADRPEEDDRG